MTRIKKSSYSMNARRSSISGFKSLYGIGKLKAIKLNCFLLNHPIQTKFSTNFQTVIKEVRQRDMLHLIPVDKKVRLYVENHMQNKILTYCYQAYRLFQNLPTRGQRTKANANAIVNQNPYLALRINISFYHNLQVAYKKRELINNGRHDELKAYTEAQLNKEKMQGQDQKQRSRETKQKYIKKLSKLKK